MASTPPLGEQEAVGYLIGTLVAFGLVAGLAIPLLIKHMKSKGIEAASVEGTDFWYSARNSQGALPIALSVFASSAGAWLLYTPCEAAVKGGWWAILAYVVCIMLAPFTMCWLAPKVREQLADGANITDWVKARFGPVAYGYTCIIMVFYMFVYIVTQLKIMGNTVDTFAGMGPLTALIPVSVVTLIYTMIGGLPASIVTDQLQGVMMLIVVMIVIFALFGWVDMGSDDWSRVSVWTDKGFEMGVTLLIAVFSAEIFNLATWQRVYAAKDVKQLRLGLTIGSGLVGLLTLLFGIVGLVSQAQDPQPSYLGALAFFRLVGMQKVGKGIIVLTYILTICMIASSVDSFQTGITSIISRELLRRRCRPLTNLLVGELFVVVVNVPAIAFAAYCVNDKGPNGLDLKVLDLFAMADILMVTLVVPIFSGLWPFTTSTGCIAGMWSGILTILAFGWFEFGTFMAGMEMLTLMTFGNTKPPDTGIYASRSCIMFFVLPLVTGFVTYTVSWMERTLEYLQAAAKPAAPAAPESNVVEKSII